MARSDWKRLGNRAWMRRDEAVSVHREDPGGHWIIARFGKVPGKPVTTWHTNRALHVNDREAMDYADTHYPMEREG